MPNSTRIGAPWKTKSYWVICLEPEAAVPSARPAAAMLPPQRNLTQARNRCEQGRRHGVVSHGHRHWHSADLRQRSPSG